MEQLGVYFYGIESSHLNLLWRVQSLSSLYRKMKAGNNITLNYRIIMFVNYHYRIINDTTEERKQIYHV